MANITSGTSVSASGFNALFTRLNNVRANHLNKDGQNADANSAFASAFSTTIAVAGEKTVPSNVQKLKDTLTTLSKSAWIDTTFASKITVPSTGALLTAANFNVYDNVVTEVEAICPNYSKYSQYNQYSQYGAYDDFTQNYGDGWWT